MFVPPLLIILAGCHDFSAAYEGATGPSPQPAHTDAVSLTSDWARLSPAERRQGLEVIRQVSADEGVLHIPGRIAIADADLPEGVAALLVQDPEFPERRLMVLSRVQSLDEAFVVGLTASVSSATPAASSAPRASRVSDGSTPTPAVWPAARVPSATGALTQRLLRYATSVRIVNIPGIGRATLYAFD
jgi:hypothetical protein